MKTLTPRSRLFLGAAPLLALALSACVSFGGKPPKKLMSLSAENRVAAGAVSGGASSGSIIVLDPEVAKKLDTVRVPVQVDATTVAYVTDAAWVDTPRHMFQGLLSETISAGGKILVLAPGQFSADPGKRLLGEIVDFGIDARTKTATVTYDATLTTPDGTTVSRKRFSASEPVSTIDAAHVGNPLNRAANKVAAEVAEWLVAQPAVAAPAAPAQ